MQNFKDTLTVQELIEAKNTLADNINSLVDEFENTNEMPVENLSLIVDIENSQRILEIKLGI